MGKRLCMWFLGGKENRKGTALLGEHEQSAACSQSYFTALMEGLLFCGVCVTLPQPLHQQVHKHHQCATLSCFIRAPSKWNLSRVSGALSLQQGQRWWHGAKKARAHFSHLNLKPATLQRYMFPGSFMTESINIGVIPPFITIVGAHLVIIFQMSW